MTVEEYFFKNKLTLEQAVIRLHDDRRDVLATKKDDSYFPKPYRLYQAGFRNMTKGATHCWLDKHYNSFAACTD